MAMALGPAELDGEDEVLSAINTTPLVDVMLVLLIIFLITIPVVVHTMPVQLPKDVTHPLQTRPENVSCRLRGMATSSGTTGACRTTRRSWRG